MKKTLSLVILLCSCAVAYGQERGLAFSKLDSLPDLLQYYLQETTSKHFEDPKVPRFLLKDRTDNFVFGIGGGVEAKLYYDYQGSKDITYSMPKTDEESRYDNDVIDLTLFSTNIVAKVLGRTKAGVIDGLISIDFGNTGGGVRLMQAYVDVFGLRVGKANSGFGDDESLDLVDGYGILTTTSRKVPQISYSYRFKKGLRLQAGVEFPQGTSVWVREKDRSSINHLDILSPDLTVNAYYNGRNIHLYGGVNSRMINFIDYGDRVSLIPAFAVQAGMNWAFVNNPEQVHKLYVQGIWSRGMPDCSSSMRDKGLSAVYDMESMKYLVPGIYGGSIGYKASFGKNTIDVAASANSVYGHENSGIGEMYDWAYAVVVNYFRNFMTYGTVGFEAIAGRRYDLKAAAYTNIRTYLFLRYNF